MAKMVEFKVGDTVKNRHTGYVGIIIALDSADTDAAIIDTGNVRLCENLADCVKVPEPANTRAHGCGGVIVPDWAKKVAPKS